jgi:hypothetical protein
MKSIVSHNLGPGKRICWFPLPEVCSLAANLLDSLMKSRYLKQANTPFFG